MRIVAVSDTHGMHSQLKIPPGDVLVHAGDFTAAGGVDGLIQLNQWLEMLPHRHKLIIAGNHDFCLEGHPEIGKTALTNAIYLQDEAVTVDGVRFYGSPWQPRFMDLAFNLTRGEALRKKWDMIPEGVDVLVTHCPPRGILDASSGGEEVGCEELRRAIKRVTPKLHIFGHVHESWGRVEIGETTFANASICDASYRPVNDPIVIDVTVGEAGSGWAVDR